MSVKNSFFPAKLHKVLCVFLCGIEIKPLYLQPLKELIIKTDVKPIKKNWIMKKLFLLAAVMLSSVGAFAQHAVGSFTLQPRLGINIATVTDLDRTKSRVDFAGGLEASIR